jgi:hypothetical protein
VRIESVELDPLDRLSNIFATDAILASQIVALRRSVSPAYRPFRKLMVAVLADALDRFLGVGFYQANPPHPQSRRGRERREASEWIFEEPGADRPFSFEWICDGLDLDAQYLRAGVERAAAKKAEKSAASKGL